MEFTIQAWKNQLQASFRQLQHWLTLRSGDVGHFSYGALAGCTLLPLLEYTFTAAQQGQSLPVSAVMSLGSIAGGVGGNILAGQIQAWYEAAAQGHVPTEADILAWLQTNLMQQDDLREALDTMLEKLEALPQAQVALSAADWQSFAQEMRQEMQTLGNLPRFQAYLQGSGVLVQGKRNVVATDNSIAIGRDVQGNVILNQYEHLDPNQTDPAALRAAYLSHILDERNQLWLGGIDPRAAAEDNDRLDLSAVYTALLTQSTEQEHLQTSTVMRDAGRQPRRFSALEQLNRQRQLVLLGDPGSGKSTFVNFVTVCLAGSGLEHPRLNLPLLTTPLPQDDEEERRNRDEKPQPQPWDHGALLPIPIVLRDFAARGLPKASQRATADHLWRFFTAELQTHALGEAAPLLKKELLEKGGVFLLDGLDEVPTADRHREHIKQVVEDMARTFRHCHILVTSRTYAYQKQDWRLPGFAETVLAPFSKGQMRQFIESWYVHAGRLRHFNQEDTQGRAALLKQAIFSSPRLYALAERPLLLTLMASLHAWRGGSLPEKREQLYADSVDLLLDLWEKQRIVRGADGEIKVIQPSLEQWLKADRDKVRGLLNRLAYEAHASQTNLVGTADIAESKLVMEMLNLSEDKSLPPLQLVEYLSNRAGLLLPHGVGVYTFPHRTFQEYLAACHLTGPEYPAKVAELARQDPARWREVALLAGAKAARGSAYALWGLVEELCHEAPGTGEEAAFWGAHLAGQFLCETADLTHLTAAQQRHRERVRGWLVQILTQPALPAVERAAAGRHLAVLGDPRAEVTDVDAMQFCYVPGGDFWMGEGQEAHLLQFLSQGYWLGRFPVTQAQYMAFVQEGGYGQAQWWAEAQAAGMWQNGAYYQRTKPYDYGRSFQYPNLPVVGVSWYEALAFSQWLTARWHKANLLPPDWRVVLPSEAEWEKAARGGLDIPTQPIVLPIKALQPDRPPPYQRQPNPAPQRPYTWAQGELTPQRANYDATEINQTSSVGGFAHAASVYGGEEMLGNVWEWTRSLKKDYSYAAGDGREKLQRGPSDWTTLRGGSWASEKQRQRCGARRDVNPYNDFRGLGFRLGLSPSDSGR